MEDVLVRKGDIIMKKVAVITDSNSGITQSEAKELGIHVVPMPFFVNGDTFYEDISMNQKEFYEYLAQGAEVTTSQPTPDMLTSLWDEVLKEYEEIVYIPMSSGLSSSCGTAMMLSSPQMINTSPAKIKNPNTMTRYQFESSFLIIFSSLIVFYISSFTSGP